MSCPPPAPPVSAELRNLALAFTILIPITVFGCWLWFYVNRTTSVFLRKRSLALVTAVCVGSSVPWACTVLYDYLGPDKYPCALYGALYYLLIPAVGAPIMLQSHVYLTEVSAQSLAMNGISLEGKSSWATFKAHVRVALFNDRTKETRLLNSQFRRSSSFFVVWIMMTSSPYLLVYLIRLATDPVWLAGCTGCHMNKVDMACLIAVNSSNFILGSLMYSIRIHKKDSLRIMRQSFMGITVPLPFTILFFALTMADPNNEMASGGLNYASLVMICAAFAVYITTAHQVMVARAIKTKILFSDNLDREDRLDDALVDKELRHELETYLLSELSSEILGFLQAVPHVKTKFQSSHEEGVAEAKKVYELFIERYKAKNEVNLPASVRDRVTERMKAGNIDATVFDEAYADVRSNFLRDGFPRFLERLKKRGPMLPKSRKTNYISSRASSSKRSMVASEEA